QGYMVLDDDVAGKSSGVGQDAMAAHLAVVADMHTSHEQAVGADPRDAAAAYRAAADGHALADSVVVAEDGFSGFTAILQILWRHAGRAERIKNVARADSGAA